MSPQQVARLVNEKIRNGATIAADELAKILCATYCFTPEMTAEVITLVNAQSK